MLNPDSDFGACETPLFWVGMAGFKPEQRVLIDACLREAAGASAWRPCRVADADVWLVNGEKCRLLPNGNLRVSPGSPLDASLNLDMRTAGRPVAFARPIVDADLEPHCTFDVNSFTSVQSMLAELESSFRFAHAQFALGAEVVERGAVLRHGVFHVSDRHKLLAILDFWRGEAALMPQLDAAQLRHANWIRQPRVPWELPSGFVRTTPAQLAWNYARRSERNLLPPRYRDRTLYYRHTPKVPLSWLRDSHLRILKELSAGSASFSELAQRTGASPPKLERDLACLFHARAITTTRSKAAPPAGLACARKPILEERGVVAHENTDATVPGLLALAH